MQDILGSVIPKKRSAMKKVVPAVERCIKAARLDPPAADPSADGAVAAQAEAR